MCTPLWARMQPRRARMQPLSARMQPLWVLALGPEFVMAPTTNEFQNNQQKSYTIHKVYMKGVQKSGYWFWGLSFLWSPPQRNFRIVNKSSTKIIKSV